MTQVDNNCNMVCGLPFALPFGADVIQTHPKYRSKSQMHEFNVSVPFSHTASVV
jgi:hypothetical protein